MLRAHSFDTAATKQQDHDNHDGKEDLEPDLAVDACFYGVAEVAGGDFGGGERVGARVARL